MPSAPFHSLFRVRPVLLVAALLIGILAIDAEVVRGRGWPRTNPEPPLPSIGDRVRYQHDGLTYEVVDLVAPTVLLRRGEDAVYADIVDIVR